MKRVALLLMLGIVTAYLAPALMPRTSRISHHHILIGNVTQAELDAHITAEEMVLPTVSNELNVRAGFILSIPFGDWTTFFAALGMCLFGACACIGIVEFLARARRAAFCFTPPFVALAKPPPRF